MHRRLWLLVGAAAAVLLWRRPRLRDDQGRRLGRSSAVGRGAVCPGVGQRAPDDCRPQGEVRPRLRRGAGRQRLQHRPAVLQPACWAASSAPTTALRGAFIQNNKGSRVKDIVSSASPATKSTLTYTIRPDAYWYWGGKKSPVTYKDFVYTWQQIDDPATTQAGRDRLQHQITGLHPQGQRSTITFKWKTPTARRLPCGPYANWSSCSRLYPSAALAGLDFNKIWTNCICGSDGKPVSERPVLSLELHQGPGHDPEGEPVLVRQEAGPEGGRLQDHHGHEHRGPGNARRRGRRDLRRPSASNLRPAQGRLGHHVQPAPGLLHGAHRHPARARARRTRCSALRGCARRSRSASTASRSSRRSTARSRRQHEAAQQHRSTTRRRLRTRPDFCEVELQPERRPSRSSRRTAPAARARRRRATPRSGPAPASRRSSAASWTAGNATRTKQRGNRQGRAQADRHRSSSTTPRAANVVFGPSGLPGGDFDIAEFAWRHRRVTRAGFVPTRGAAAASRTTRLLQQQGRRADADRRTRSSTRRSALR